MYKLIQNGMATKMELHEYYTLDEALKLFALMTMSQDIEATRAAEINDKTKR